MKSIDPANIVGLREWVDLPQLGTISLRAKIDTGANTSTLHASDIQPFERDGQPWVRFTAYLGTQVQRRHRCEAPLVSLKTIKSSNGHSQSRYVISTRLTLGRHSWPIELTLACRKTMRYRMLLGCKALVDGRLLVDPARSYVQDKPLLALGDA